MNTPSRQSLGGRSFPAEEGLRGTVRVPGDKSISHRAVLLGAVSCRSVAVSGFLRSADTLATVEAVRSLGVEVTERDTDLVVHGAGWEGLKEPEDVIDVANAGTLMRLLPGIVAGREFTCVITGDASIRQRPMARVLRPLQAMGAGVTGRAGGTLPPICIHGGTLRGTDHDLEVASAQVKSCLLLAGLRAQGPSSIREPGASRDHTERMIRQGAGRVERVDLPDGAGEVRVWPLDRLDLSQVDVPGDFSSAAFLVVAALLVPGSEVIVEDVGLNPTRIGLLNALERMGAQVTVEISDVSADEPVGRITSRYSELTATDIRPSEVPNVIDELPVFMLAAAKAAGTSSISGAAELRVKESDRLQAMAELLSSIGVTVNEKPDGIEIEGSPTGWRGGDVRARDDHRLAMVAAIAGCVSSAGVSVDDAECIDVSFPGFVDILRELGGRWESDG